MLQTQENGDGKNVEELYYSSGLQVITDSCDDELQSCYDIFTRLNSIIAFPMHLNTIIHECIEDTLKPRVSMANRFVIEAFFTEHKIRDHFNNLQNVFLFAAGDAMQVLYSQIFKKVSYHEKMGNFRRFRCSAGCCTDVFGVLLDDWTNIFAVPLDAWINVSAGCLKQSLRFHAFSTNTPIHSDFYHFFRWKRVKSGITPICLQCNWMKS